MSRRQATSKQTYRFVIYDSSIYAWGVKDSFTGEIMKDDFYSPMDARSYAEDLNIRVARAEAISAKESSANKDS